jgi:hypothetical protein
VEEGTLITVRYTVQDTEYECDCGAIERQRSLLWDDIQRIESGSRIWRTRRTPPTSASRSASEAEGGPSIFCHYCKRWHDAYRIVDPELQAKIARLAAVADLVARYKAWAQLGRDLAVAETERRTRWWKAWRSAWRSIGYFARINLEHGWRRTPDPSPHQP